MTSTVSMGKEELKRKTLERLLKMQAKEPDPHFELTEKLKGNHFEYPDGRGNYLHEPYTIRICRSCGRKFIAAISSSETTCGREVCR